MKRTLVWMLASAMLLAVCLMGVTGCADGESAGETTVTTTEAVTTADDTTTADTTASATTEAPATEAPVTTEEPATEAPVTEPVYVAVDSITENVVAKEDGFVYLDVKSELISLGGIAASDANNGEYYRFVASNKTAYPEDIQREGATMAGGTLRFCLQGGSFRLKAVRRTDFEFANKFGSYSFDVYVGSGSDRALLTTLTSPFDQDFESENIVLPEGVQEVMICLPYTMGFTDLQIAFEEGASVAAPPARLGGVIGFYGSSITQGYDASSPSLSYAMTLCRELDADCVNFGLSGAARGEKAVIDDICAKIKGAGLTAFVLDYDWNINSSTDLKNGSAYWNGYGYYTIYEKLREALGPNVPIIMLSRPWFGAGSAGVSGVELDNCIRVISEACDTAIAAGDNMVAFRSGKFDFFGDEGRSCHADNIHPNDKGHGMMAAVVKEALDELRSAS